jgi:hypothetical protein
VDPILKKAKQAISDVYGDLSVTRSVTKGRLEALREELDALLDTLDDVGGEDDE